ncbi:molecular chaperone (small heat shock protein) [Mycolicibacterium chubuense NBB4]|uniref:Molecular chaperone (Small heat shock protein) n=1 Tax=Mycolicibacterium chubuense (strain NBB4) TaxID=710421 RepID=I4BCS2_MYCCN|nr:Hsp20/alpha crystallin family protein [Mycolicibacterium chubuense]AFM15079.1 molecular chaperone (small heat shock protein) [Mycolicibacterium chubuense NBB4]
MSNVGLWARPAWTTANTERWVRDFFGSATAGDWAAGVNPAVEVDKDGDDAVIRVDLPGVDVDKDVHVEVDKGRLVIRGERRDEREEESRDDGRVRKISEVRYGSFHRSFALPAHVTGDAVSASYDAGVLTVRVAGAHKGAEAQRIAIDSK